MAELTANSIPADRTVLIQRNTADYDQTNAAEVLTSFNHFLADVVTRYESNQQMIADYDRKSNDLLHLIELKDNMNASEGYKTYRKLASVRRERRICKNENELLSAIYTYIQQNPRFVNDIASILGKTRAAKASINQKIYCARTDII